MSALIEAKGLAAGYGADNVVVRDLDLTIGAGEIVALLGPNGAGKTTTLLTLCGELTPLGGIIHFDGKPDASPLYKRARAGLGLVTEQRSVFTQLSVADNLKVSRCDQDHALEIFPELAEHLKRRVGLLSGGQQQMLAMARALSRGTPRVLLIDEISLGLAPLVVDRLLGAVKTAAAAGVGVLLVEQYVHKAMNIADRLYVMRRGRVVVSGTTGELRDDVERIQDSYLTSAPRRNDATSAL